MHLNVTVSIMSLVFSSGSLCAGIFGMNLLSGLEAHPSGIAHALRTR
jgi:hypothetical protein